jgi:tetratricopeptide (TPR) repeat protein
MLNSITVCYCYLKKTEDAMAHFKMCAEFQIQEFREGKDVAETYANMGMASMDIQDYDSALRCFHRALRITASLGGDDCELALLLASKGRVYTAMGNHDDAANSYAQSLHIRMQRYASARGAEKKQENAFMAEMYVSMGDSLLMIGKYDKALENYDKGLHVALKIFGADHDHVVTTQQSMAKTREWQNMSKGIGNDKT